MADITVSNDVDALMRSADNEAIRTSIGVPTPEEIMNPLVEGQGLLNSFVGSAAAYSLRDLNKTNPDVVEVRRGSDETSRVFKANEIGSTLTNWVNAEVALPLDTASGAAAAYSLRNLSTSYSGNVVDVRRSSDDTEASFTAAEVAGSTMVDWVNTDVDIYPLSQTLDGFVSSSGTSVVSGGERTFSPSTSSSSHSLRYTPDIITYGETYEASVEVYIDPNNTTLLGVYAGNDGAVDLNHWGGYDRTTQMTTTGQWATISGQFTASASGSHGIAFWTTNGTSQNWSYTGNTNDVIKFRNLIVTQTESSGHVTKWYDQSGNDNHAVQATPASQPKVVEGGVLLNEIKFDGVDDVLNFSEIDFSTNSWMLSAVVDWDGSISPIVGGSITQWSLLVGSSDNFSARAVSDSIIHNFNPTASITTGDGLFTFQRSSDVLSGYYSGSVTNADPAIDITSTFKADKLGRRGTVYSSSGIKEVIIYNSDQSDNRKAIESNMADYHGNIDLPAGFDSGNNEVDGYVATWYDQSGNGNNATQPVSTSQPKIVVNGDLWEDGIKFDGVNDYLYNATLTTSNAADTVAIVGTINANGGAFIDSHNGGASGTYARTVFYLAGDAEFSAYYGNTTDYTYGAYNSNQNLHFIVKSQYGSLNGVTDVLNSGSATLNGIRIGISRAMTDPLDGTVQEIIVYDSDQSLVRKSIEFNINNAYSIY